MGGILLGGAVVIGALERILDVGSYVGAVLFSILPLAASITVRVQSARTRGSDGFAVLIAQLVPWQLDTPYLPLVAVLLMVLGVLAILRSVLLVTSKTPGRFPGDPWSGLLVGAALCLLGRALLD